MIVDLNFKKIFFNYFSIFKKNNIINGIKHRLNQTQIESN